MRVDYLMCPMSTVIVTHLLVSEAVVGLQGEAEDLPEQHSEGPDIALRGVPNR